jgi:hypothetical protein
MTIPEQSISAIDKALAELPDSMDSDEARVMLFAIGLQESGFNSRVQIVAGTYIDGAVGKARGWWQFEENGGCAGVLQHRSSRDWMRSICIKRGVERNKKSLWTALAKDDVLAACAARLLLWTDPKPLPAPEDEAGAWDLYLRVWRPGKPHPTRWPACHAKALDCVVSRLS